jgi:hypothetical protein
MTGSLESETGTLKPEARTILISGFRFLTSVFLISVFSLLTSAPAAQAACSSPAGSAGHVIYNKDYHVPTYCDGTNWKPMGPTGAGGTGCGNVSSGLVGWWKLDETSGTSAADSSGNGNAGTLAGGDGNSAWVAAMVNNGRQFTSSNVDYITVGNPSALQITGSMTVAAWVKIGGNGCWCDSSSGGHPLSLVASVERRSA